MKDNVNHPSHYETGKFECIEVMLETQGKEAVKNFCICNAFKYIYRHNNKNGVEDIKKAKWYLDKYIEIDESEECKDPITDRLSFINENFHKSIERYGIETTNVSSIEGSSVIFVATNLKDKPSTQIDINLPDVEFYKEFVIFLFKCERKDSKKEDWTGWEVKVGRAMENAIKEATHKANKEKLVVSDKVLEDLVEGARKCCEDICNGTINADNETGYDKGVDLKKPTKLCEDVDNNICYRCIYHTKGKNYYYEICNNCYKGGQFVPKKEDKNE